MHRPHHPQRRPSAISSATQDAEDAVFTRADRPVITDHANAVTHALAFLDRSGALGGEL
ncbi:MULTISPECIES: ABC transporter related protein [Streptomyces]|uniref:ABC transporter related protein n=1 Tax=Streptomyces flavovirens TaxID=52258 RepID=A0ABV8NCB7_9ACTN|nr:ABC transporter related protein [Streptomyces sp. MBT51]MBK3596151.1 ABC transporter related protein [Streptomyces sp. MBT51]